MSKTAEPQAVETKTAPEVEQMVKVKYNHEEKEIPLSEAITLAQKGMNYDKMTDREQATADKLKNIESKLTQYEQAEEQRTLTQKATALAEKDGIPPEIAQQLVEAQRRADKAEQQNTTLKSQSAVDNQIQSFVKARPDVNLAEIPDEVLETAKRTGDLLVAYQSYEAVGYKAKVAELEKQVGTKKVNDDNSSSSMGSAASAGDATPVEFTVESINEMSSAQQRKHMKDIVKFMNSQNKK